MKKGLFIIILLCSFSISAQTPYSSWELGLFGGESYYLGELNKTHFIPFNAAFGPRLRYNYDQRLSLTGSLTIGKIEGSDAQSNNSFNQDRNFAFYSQIVEGALVGEFNFFPYSALDDKAYLSTPFIFLGLGVTHHDPKADFNGILIGTQNLATEGKRYKKNILSVPIGVGLKMRLNRFGFELSWAIRKTYSDYLDDVSTNYLPASNTSSTSQASISNTTQYDNVDYVKRGDQYSKDWYVFTGLSIFVNLTPKKVCRTF